MKWRALVVFAGVLVAPVTASAAVGASCVQAGTLSSPFAWVFVNGQCTDFSSLIQSTANGFWSTSMTVQTAVANVSVVELTNVGVP